MFYEVSSIVGDAKNELMMFDQTCVQLKIGCLSAIEMETSILEVKSQDISTFNN
jgi:hypothetical protein